MSISQMVKVWEHEFAHPEQAVMMALADHAHEDGKGIRPSLDRIAWKTGYSRRNVQLIIRRLEKDGVIYIEKESTNTEPAHLAFDWSKAKLKPSFEEYKVGLPSRNRGLKKKRGENISPPENELGVKSQINGGEISDQLGVKSQINFGVGGEISDQLGVIHSSPEPSLEPSEFKPSFKPSLNPRAREKNPAEQGEQKNGKVYNDPLAAQFAPKPWRSEGKIRPEIIEFVAKSFEWKTEKHPKTAARNHILNLERTGNPLDLEKLQGYCNDLEATQNDSKSQNSLEKEKIDRLARIERESRAQSDRELGIA